MKWFKVLLKWAKYYERMMRNREYGSNIGTYKDASAETLNILFLHAIYSHLTCILISDPIVLYQNEEENKNGLDRPEVCKRLQENAAGQGEEDTPNTPR